MHELHFKKHCTDILIDQTFDQKRTLTFLCAKNYVMMTDYTNFCFQLILHKFSLRPCQNAICKRWSDADLASAMDMLKMVAQCEIPLQSWVLHSPLCSLVFLGKCGKLSLSMKGRCPPIVRFNTHAYYDKNKT